MAGGAGGPFRSKGSSEKKLSVNSGRTRPLLTWWLVEGLGLPAGPSVPGPVPVLALKGPHPKMPSILAHCNAHCNPPPPFRACHDTSVSSISPNCASHQHTGIQFSLSPDTPNVFLTPNQALICSLIPKITMTGNVGSHATVISKA